MTEQVKTCGTCNVQVTNDYIEFSCPKCMESKIVRCMHCRKTAKEYTCPKCGFTGP